MSKFNATVIEAKTKTTNVAGGVAYKESDKLELISTLLTSFLGNKFYETENQTSKRISELISKIPDKKFIAKSAIYARTKYGMRSVSHLVAGEIVRLVKNEEWTKEFINKVVYRPDDMLEILAYYIAKYNKPIPNCLKKGLAKAFNKFDKYDLAKYKGESKSISLVDLVNLVHPIPNIENETALRELMKGKLKSTDTWEAKLSKSGQEAESEEDLKNLKKEAWSELIKTRKLGYFALLRNLRNIIEQAPEAMPQALEMLVDENLIKKSLVLPFRYMTALKEIEKISGDLSRKTIVALNRAVDIACKNVPKFEGKTLIALDCSGSMTCHEIRGTTPAEIGALFASVLFKAGSADLLLFAEKAWYVNLNPEDSTLSLLKQISSKFTGGGTNFPSIFKTINSPYDRIIILSDMQGWMEDTDSLYNSGGSPRKSFSSYKGVFNINPKVFSFNLNDYGQIMFPENNVYCLAGFSDKTLDVMQLLEKDKQALFNEIEKINL